MAPCEKEGKEAAYDVRKPGRTPCLHRRCQVLWFERGLRAGTHLLFVGESRRAGGWKGYGAPHPDAHGAGISQGHARQFDKLSTADVLGDGRAGRGHQLANFW